MSRARGRERPGGRALVVAVAVGALASPGILAGLPRAESAPPPPPQGAYTTTVVGEPPSLQAEVAIAVDASTGDVLFAREPDERRAIASATKLMTALLVLEQADLGDVVEAVPYQALAVESKIGLEPGERMTVRDLLTALLLESANDAAVTLAEALAGSEPEFVEEMNERAMELGLDGTSFANPVGLDHPDNFSTAHDLATLTRLLMEDRRFARIVGQTEATLESGSRPRVVENRNELVGTKLVDGVKTGFTRAAGNVLVGFADRGGARVISIVLGEPSEAARDDDTVALLEYALDQFERSEVIAAGERVAARPTRYGDDEPVPLVAAGPVVLTLRRGTADDVTVLVSAPRELEGPIAAGTRVGTAEVRYGGAVAKEVPLETGAEVAAPGLLTRARLALERRLGWLLGIAIAIVAAVVLARSRTRRTQRGPVEAG